MALIRTQISLGEAERRVLDAAHRRTGQSMSSLIRDAIHLTYGAPISTERVRVALDSTFGVVTSTASGEEMVESIRSGRRLAQSA